MRGKGAGVEVVGAFAFLVLAAGCAREAPEPPLLAAATLVVAGYDSLEVRLDDGVGSALSADGTTVHAGITDWVLRTDVDADGDRDAVVVTFVDHGHGADFDVSLFSLDEAVGGRGHEWRWVDSSPIGRQIRVRAATYDSGVLELHLTTHRQEDEVCCPSLEVEQRWAVSPDGVEALGGATPSGGGVI